jgi:hypothetical protein
MATDRTVEREHVRLLIVAVDRERDLFVEDAPRLGRSGSELAT